MVTTNTASYWRKKGVVGQVFRAAVRTLQCIFAIVVAILYGLDLVQATNNDTTAGSAWVYAELVAGVSMIFCLVHLFFAPAVWYWGLLDVPVFVLWLAQFGVFASIYLGAEDKLDKDGFSTLVSHSRMRAAVWVNLVSMLLWFATTVQGAIGCCARRKKAQQKNRTMALALMNEP
jgi:hypothetical protein